MIYIIVFVTLLLFNPIALSAQDSLHTETDLPEITELNYDELEQQNWRLAEPAEEETFYRPEMRLG
ncbi:MAG: hypothetical protein R6V77_01105, partial [Candidatus Cloacimonadaceae bacterium]